METSLSNVHILTLELGFSALALLRFGANLLLWWGLGGCLVHCLTASLAPPYQIPVAIFPFFTGYDNQKCFQSLQMTSGGKMVSGGEPLG